MKILTILCVFMCSMTSLHGQIQKGNWLLEGSVNWSGSSSNSDQVMTDGSIRATTYSTMQYSLRPRAGFFVSNRTLMGLGIEFENNQQKRKIRGASESTPSLDFNSFLVALNPYLTRYTQIADNFYFTANFNLIAGLGEETNVGANSTSTAEVSEIELNGIPGLTYLLSEKWAFKGEIGKIFLNRREVSNPSGGGDGLDFTSVDISYGLTAKLNTFSVGFLYFFVKKNED